VELNADFSRRAAVHAARLPWVASPIAGVERRMLDRIGDEVARATSIVRYAPDSHFSPHTHGGGEEFLVLDGVFQDEHGDYPAGSYVRNPPTSAHTPGSAPGCTLFVKLWQFDPDDRTDVRNDTRTLPFIAAAGRPGVDLMPLFQDRRRVRGGRRELRAAIVAAPAAGSQAGGRRGRRWLPRLGQDGSPAARPGRTFGRLTHTFVMAAKAGTRRVENVPRPLGARLRGHFHFEWNRPASPSRRY
jgi:hypothetical protein